jgi:hypothetical protein
VNRRPTIAEIKAHALHRVEDIVSHHDMAPGGKILGGLYSPRNPTRNDNKPGSFVVYLRGAKRGGFVEYANPDQEKGDIIHFVAYCLSGGGDFRSKDALRRACEWLSQFLGLDFMPLPQRAAALDRARRENNRRENQEERLLRFRKTCADLFGQSESIIGTAADTYLRKVRGIDIASLPFLENDLRFCKSMEWWMGRKRDGDRVIARGPFYPVMLAAIRDRNGKFLSLHRTFLLPDGSGKAPVAKPKLIFPDYSGGVIRLCRGDSNLTPEEAAEKNITGPCGIAEGIEDGLTFVEASGGAIRTWAAVALSNFTNVPDLACVDGWYIQRQNDWGKRAAVKAYERGLTHFQDTGKPVAEVAAFGGKDLNETWTGR